ncbi:MAG TPA: hypothetical protein VET27_10820 [Mycobacterium sp.]|nr:hypothetical protein [Mycobacterium sp.]
MANRDGHELDACADRRLAVVAEVEDFAWDYAEANGHWLALLLPLLPEIRKHAEGLADAYGDSRQRPQRRIVLWRNGRQ